MNIYRMRWHHTLNWLSAVSELSGCLRAIHSKWLEHESGIESSSIAFPLLMLMCLDVEDHDLKLAETK